MTAGGMTVRDVLWLRYRTGTWHAWRRGAGASVCGRLNVEDLRRHPATATGVAVPRGHGRTPCAACAARLSIRLTAPGGPPDVAAWERLVRTRARRAHVTPRDADVRGFAEVLAQVGKPGDAEAVQVFEAVAAVVMRPVRKTRRGQQYTVYPGFREALAKIPRGDPGRVRHVALAIESWRRITGRDPAAERCRPDVVVETALAVPNPEAYVRHLAARGLDALAAVYHPNTLRRARGELRGMFWDGARGGDDDPLRGVEVVRD